MNIIPPFDDFVNYPYPGGSILQGFAENPDFYWGEHGHPGIDLYPKVGGYGKPLKMVSSGVVSYNLHYLNGYQILIQSDEGDIAYNFIYGHLTAERPLEGGKWYPQGTICGYMGNSGFVVSGGVSLWNGANPDPNKGGTHLHLGCQPYSKITGLPLKPPGSTVSGYINWLPMLNGNKDMFQLFTVDGVRVYAVLNGIRFWVLDPYTMTNGNNKLWGTTVVTDPSVLNLPYGGSVFLSGTDDPK